MTLMWFLRIGLLVEVASFTAIWQTLLGAAAALPMAVLSMWLLRLGFSLSTLLLARPRWTCAHDWLRSLFGEAMAMWRAYTWDMAWKVSGGGPHTSGPSKPLVVLVHGFLCNGGVWNVLTQKLDAEGIDWIAPSLPAWYARIGRNRGLLIRRLRATGRRPLIMVGHSMGGVLAADFARRHPRRCLGTIALAAPFAGTGLARFVLAGTCGPFTRTAQWLSEPRRRITAQALTSIYSLHDNLVTPQLSARIEGADNRALAGLGHLAICQSPESLDLVLQQIRQLTTVAQEDPAT